MLLGPIFSVELVTGARRSRYFVIRVLYGLILLLALWVVYFGTFRNWDPTDIGAVARFAAAFFATFTWIQLLAVPTLYQFAETISMTGPSRQDPEWFLGFVMVMTTLVACGALLLVGTRSATAVTSEKERESWASLLSTPLSPREIVTAKVFGSIYAVRGVFLLLAFIWLLAVIVDPGFVIPLVFIAGSLLLLSFVASSLGVMLSLWCGNSLRAMAATLAIGVFVGGGYLFCCVPLTFSSRSGSGIEIMAAPCMPFLVAFPGITYCEGLEDTLRNVPGLFAAYVLGIIGYSVAGLLLIAGAIGNFDQLSGRTGTIAPLRPPRIPSDPPQLVVPEVVEEE